MTFLPLVGREMRAVARHRGILRVRWWAALLAISVAVVLLAALAATSSGSRLSKPFFSILTGYAFGLSLLTGILTADSLSSERREGTLGLLFLTELKGYDVVLGKFIPSLLNSFYILLALLPITALPLLFGGITITEFWRRAMALTDALFVSLAGGTLVSALQRDSQRAMVGALALVLLLVGGLPGLAYLCRQTGFPAWFLSLRWFSPFYPYAYSADNLYARQSDLYWEPLFGSALLGLLFLLVASCALPRLRIESSLGWTQAVRSIAAIFRGRLDNRMLNRGKRLTKNPIVWLTQAELGIPWGAWAVVTAWAITISAALLFQRPSATALMLSHSYVEEFGFVLKMLFAIQACKFFSEGRCNGNLELLLCTPLKSREIVNGVAFGLWLRFRWPLIIFILFLFLPLSARFATAFFHGQIALTLDTFGVSFLGGVYTVRMLLDLLAITWFGIGMALSMKKPQLASGLTILYVLILPSVLSACFLDIVPDVFFIVWGTSKAGSALRRFPLQQWEGH
jgi:ABC-type transport system involved in multi-copper enzyme maturation permease subunit